MRWNDLMMTTRMGARPLLRPGVQAGVTAMEYALPIGLVVVLTIPALGALGDMTNGMFGGMLGISQPAPAQEIASAEEVIGAPSQAVDSGDVSTETPSDPADVGATPADPTPAPATSPPQSVPSNVTVSFDPATGMIKYTGYDAAGNKIETTDASGTELTLYMAQMLENLAATATKDNGQPLPPAIIGYIKDLANKGYDLSSKEKTVVDNNTLEIRNTIDLDALYGPAAQRTAEQKAEINAQFQDITDFTYSLYYMKQSYDALMSYVGNKNGYTELKSQISLYSGVISSVGIQNFHMQQTANQTTGSSTFYNSYGFGSTVNTSAVSLDMSPIVTHIESGNIEQTANQVP
ncbi:MAG: Flp family type IVb pilin [Candidatus Melainabacteria bacterium]